MSDQRLTDDDLSDIERETETIFGFGDTDYQVEDNFRRLLAELRRTRVELEGALADLLHYSHLHWEDCPLDQEDCYLCEGYERIEANARDRKAAQGE